jgi:hypothetical protein
MTFCISFPQEAFKNTADAFKFIVPYLGFHKEGILSSGEDDEELVEFDERKIEAYLNEHNLTNFSIVSNASAYLEFDNSVTFRRSELKSLCLFFCSVQKMELLNLAALLKAAALKGFTTAFIYDSGKSKWQNQEIVANYKTFGRPYAHLPKRWDPTLSPGLGELIDISKNPGHNKETYTMNLMAAPEIWFGPGSWEYFVKEKITSFPFAKEIRNIDTDILYVKLFDWNAPDYETPEILAIQSKFREWTGMNEIEEQLNRKVKSAHQALEMRIEIDEHGNTIKTQQTIWNILNLTNRKKK